MLVKDWEIKNASYEDADFFLNSFREIYGHHFDVFFFVEFFKKKINSPHSILCVAVNSNGNRIGCFVCEKQELFQDLKPVLQIKEFYISPKYRKLKLADDIYAYIEQKAFEIGFSRIEVMCNIKATTTHNFYRRKKFEADKKLYTKSL